MVKGKGRQRATSTSAINNPVRLIGVLADDSNIRTVNVPRSMTIGNVVSTVASDLQAHVNSAFSLNDNGIILDTDNVTIPGLSLVNSRSSQPFFLIINLPGIAGYDPTKTVNSIANQLPPNTYMAVLYTPIEPHTKRITDHVNEMAVDQLASGVEKNRARHLSLYLKPGSSCDIPVSASEKSTTPSDKLDQLLHIVNKLQVEIGELRADNAVLKADNTTLKQRVGVLEEETQELREAVNGVSFHT